MMPAVTRETQAQERLEVVREERNPRRRHRPHPFDIQPWDLPPRSSLYIELHYPNSEIYSRLVTNGEVDLNNPNVVSFEMQGRLRSLSPPRTNAIPIPRSPTRRNRQQSEPAADIEMAPDHVYRIRTPPPREGSPVYSPLSPLRDDPTPSSQQRDHRESGPAADIEMAPDEYLQIRSPREGFPTYTPSSLIRDPPTPCSPVHNPPIHYNIRTNRGRFIRCLQAGLPTEDACILAQDPVSSRYGDVADISSDVEFFELVWGNFFINSHEPEDEEPYVPWRQQGVRFPRGGRCPRGGMCPRGGRSHRGVRSLMLPRGGRCGHRGSTRSTRFANCPCRYHLNSL